MNDCLNTVTKQFTISSKAKSKEEAISKIFSMLKGAVYNEIKKPIVHMNTENICIESIDENKYTEKFLFLFMPREKIEYNVTLNINVLIKYVDI